MSKALLTMYAGDCSVIRPVALPTLERYAERYGYEVKIAEPVGGLPAAWGKVAALRTALESSEFALWIDGDALLTPAADDLSDWLSANAFQCFSQDRRLPFALNSWLWGIRACDESRRFLEELWGRRRFHADPNHHRFWDLGAIHQVLAEQPEFQVGTVLLGPEWNCPGTYRPEAYSRGPEWPDPQGKAFHAGGDGRDYLDRAVDLSAAIQAHHPGLLGPKPALK